ncbi:N-formylglutamate amidohydrolase [Noviherbaspirillum pedocola]|uniref:N-formylglutamate amidohydrolase n=1 Tax=Noviherbaspirillum pedocola TaxID=2801341 RepID=A0A934SN40_9BURK|nr:N-formylglutamate amidohydrolase [Noviherbaspirillum pedocola]MBK4733591.1 N-formylglutamate amidohydrolase [Noviherbaspirillum pedocola]
MERDAFLISCEHGGKRVPPQWRALFAPHAALLSSHRGYDKGALRMARELAAALDAPLFAATVSRLLIELNRSPGHPQLYSAVTRALSVAERRDIFEHCYLPYRRAVEERIADLVAQGRRVIHVSSHSFTPELDGAVRNADIGLLYDPKRHGEAALCRRWREALGLRAPALRVRMNYPYAGSADGFTTWLRRRFGAEQYVGIELEINQKHASMRSGDWPALRAAVIAALREAGDAH